MVELRLAAGANGAPPIVVVDKHVTDEAHFEHQVRWLTRARDHRVARLRTVEPRSQHYTTSFIGGHTMATMGTSPRVASRLLVPVVEALGRLHRAGLVHGAIRPEHIVLAPDGPRLISPRAGRSPDDDIAALGSLIEQLGMLWTIHSHADDIGARWGDVGRRLADGGSGQGLLSATAIRSLIADLEPDRRRRFQPGWR